jgi:hypothetical protein
MRMLKRRWESRPRRLLPPFGFASAEILTCLQTTSSLPPLSSRRQRCLSLNMEAKFHKFAMGLPNQVSFSYLSHSVPYKPSDLPCLSLLLPFLSSERYLQMMSQGDLTREFPNTPLTEISTILNNLSKKVRFASSLTGQLLSSAELIQVTFLWSIESRTNARYGCCRYEMASRPQGRGEEVGPTLVPFPCSELILSFCTLLTSLG